MNHRQPSIQHPGAKELYCFPCRGQAGVVPFFTVVSTGRRARNATAPYVCRPAGLRSFFDESQSIDSENQPPPLAFPAPSRRRRPPPRLPRTKRREIDDRSTRVNGAGASSLDEGETATRRGIGGARTRLWKMELWRGCERAAVLNHVATTRGDQYQR